MTVPTAATTATPPRTGVLRGTVRTVGELLVTAGVLALLLVVYQLWWTGVQSAHATQVEQDQIIQQWQHDDPVAPSKPKAVKPIPGKGFALLYIPRLKDRVWGLPVIEGVGLDVLAKGAGHYPGTAVPGEIGNFALAAHRATHNEPFADIDRLRAGDKVYVQTESGWYTYVLDRDQIVQPTATWVIDPVPGKPGAAPTEALITLTTCNPRWASYERWIWWGHLVHTRAASQGPPDRVSGVL